MIGNSTTRGEFRMVGPPYLRSTASTCSHELSDSRRERTRYERHRSRPSPHRERGRLKRLGFAPWGSRNRLDKVSGIGNPAEDAALGLDHFEPHALELGEVRRHAITQHDAFIAAVIGLANGRMHTHFE